MQAHRLYSDTWRHHQRTEPPRSFRRLKCPETPGWFRRSRGHTRARYSTSGARPDPNKNPTTINRDTDYLAVMEPMDPTVQRPARRARDLTATGLGKDLDHSIDFHDILDHQRRQSREHDLHQVRSIKHAQSWSAKTSTTHYRNCAKAEFLTLPYAPSTQSLNAYSSGREPGAVQD